jgi:hypothetical protein
VSVKSKGDIELSMIPCNSELQLQTDGEILQGDQHYVLKRPERVNKSAV